MKAADIWFTAAEGIDNQVEIQCAKYWLAATERAMELPSSPAVSPDEARSTGEEKVLRNQL